MNKTVLSIFQTGPKRVLYALQSGSWKMRVVPDSPIALKGSNQFLSSAATINGGPPVRSLPQMEVSVPGRNICPADIAS